MTVSVLIPYRGDDGPRDAIFDWILKRYKALFPDYEICVGTTSHNPFSRSKARNEAFRASSGDVLLVADADTVPEVEALRLAEFKLETGAPWVIPYDMYYNLGKKITRKILASSPSDDVRFVEKDCEHVIKSTAGMLMMSRDAWYDVGGYDERFIGWGYEDNAFQLSLDTLVGPHERCLNGRGVHMWHPAPESVRFGQPMIRNNRELFGEYVKARNKPDRMRRVRGL